MAGNSSHRSVSCTGQRLRRGAPRHLPDEDHLRGMSPARTTTIDAHHLSQAPPLSIHEVANYLGVSGAIVRSLVRKGLLRGAKIGGQWRIQPADLAEFIIRSFERPK